MRPFAARPARYRVVFAWVLLAVQAVAGQPGEEYARDLADRPISTIRVEGLQRVDEQLVRNQLRSAVGDPYDPPTVKDDVARLYRLGEFRSVTAEAELQTDGSVILSYRVVEAAIIAEVQVVGNKVISDQELLAATRLVRGVPRDDFLIENAERAIEDLYHERGHYLTTVEVDESELEETGILFFRVIEGPRVKVRAIEFDGNSAFSDKQLHAEISTRTAMPLVRRGELDEERLIDDVAALDRYYKARGYLDVRVDRTIELSPDNTEVKVTFLIVEGRQYTLRSIQIEPDPLKVFAREQIAAMLEIRPGDVYSREKIRASLQVVREAYMLMGYLDLQDASAIRATELRGGDEPEVDLLLEIDEGNPYKVGPVEITGNFLTQDKVIRRHVRLQPGRPFDARQIQRSANRIRATRLFNAVNITVQNPDPEHPEYRDVLVEVKEANTGSVNFGIAAGSDTGLFGEFSLIQRNFDVTDLPESPRELVSGRAFRGAGQRFSMTLRPGDELFQYAVSLTEPNIFDTDNSLRVTGSFRDREFRSSGRRLYDEERLTLTTSLGRKLGDVWDFALNSRFENVELDNISLTAPRDIFEAAGPDNVTSVGVGLTRSTVRTITRPGEGSRFELSLSQVGALGGDYDYTMASTEYTVFLTVDRDFLGRKSILRLNSRMGYIFGGDAPVYDRFYLGGRSFRGFDFREVSPKGISLLGTQTDDPVGGDWLFFAGAQYEFPLIQEALTGVFFLDSGTVVDDPGFDDYRVSIGAGIRIYIPQFGPVPIAFDFGVPIQKEDSDDTQVLSFSAELPF
ncbi:MAG: outer membrane protein assembly factor BamA [Planctomycetota bacterium]|jgi:outer membrane protein assembly factor BamA